MNSNKKTISKTLCFLKWIPIFMGITMILTSITGCSNPSTEKVSLPNGHVLILKPSRQTQSVSLHYFLNPAPREAIPGLGNFCIRLMLKATQKHNPQQLAQLIESRGGSIGGMWDYDYAGFSVLATHKNFIDQTQLLLEIINSPKFDEGEFNKLKKEILQEIKNRKEDAFNPAYESLLKQMFAVAPLSGTEQSISQITTANVQNFYKNQIQGKPAIIAIVGNFSPQAVKKIFSHCNAQSECHSREGGNLKLESNSPSKIEIPAFAGMTPKEDDKSSAPPKFKELKISAPFVAQTYLLGFVAPNLKSDDYPTFKVLNNLLGGKSSSRIFMNIRERQGLGYALGSFYPSRQNNAHLVCYIQVDPRAAKFFPKLFTQETKKLKKEIISDEELQAAIEHVKGQFIMDHQSNSRQSWYLGWFESQGMGWEYDQSYPKLLDKVTAQDVLKVSKTYFNPVWGIRVGN
jgi:predicted Zn-dependent peptidase